MFTRHMMQVSPVTIQVTVVKSRCMFCSSLAVLDQRVGHSHTIDLLSPLSLSSMHFDRLFHGESCPRIDVVHPGRAWSSSPACGPSVADVVNLND